MVIIILNKNILYISNIAIVDEVNAFLEALREKVQQEIIELRKKYKVSQSSMSEILGFGANTYNKYEKGEVPSRSNGKTL